VSYDGCDWDYLVFGKRVWILLNILVVETLVLWQERVASTKQLVGTKLALQEGCLVFTKHENKQFFLLLVYFFSN
jgi:hypothetical protein